MSKNMLNPVDIARSLSRSQEALMHLNLEKAAVTEEVRSLLEQLDRSRQHLSQLRNSQQSIHSETCKTQYYARKEEHHHRQDVLIKYQLVKDVKQLDIEIDEIKRDCDKLHDQIAAENNAIANFQEILDLGHKELQLQLRERDNLKKQVHTGEKQKKLRKDRMQDYINNNSHFLGQLPLRSPIAAAKSI